MSRELEQLKQLGTTVSYKWLEMKGLLEELPTPAEDVWSRVPQEEWRDNMFFDFKLGHWIYMPEDS